ncbi:DUF4256 domain-containing protein [Kaistella palustris]|uniref:DUF4256 domain-containing protein n=1 Tax=Kaistella palustris TaxID=493376 RepID=UPI000411FE00|nr:DUF4256 domain-containing protein [Kaistella palustris]
MTNKNSSTELLQLLEARFENNKNRHANLSWKDIKKKLEKYPEKLESLKNMEKTGGEPDVVGVDGNTGEYLFMDCVPESPIQRRSLCYDQVALEKRKENKPAGNAVTATEALGVELLTEEEYRYLQTVGKFDLKTSSWLKTPENIRKLGGAVFGDRRYDTVFVYHNGAESYYAGRGFRGVLRV